MVDALIAALSKEPWVASGVDDEAERADSVETISVAAVDHDDPTFSVAFRDEAK